MEGSVDLWMKLSEAMRLGALLRPQAFHVLYSTTEQTSCALGAACEAIGLLDTTQDNAYAPGAKVPAEWRWLARGGTCPACRFHDSVQEIVFHLNNDHRWTREQIANWVASQEAVEEPEAVGAVARVGGLTHD